MVDLTYIKLSGIREWRINFRPKFCLFSVVGKYLEQGKKGLLIKSSLTPPPVPKHKYVINDYLIILF